MERTKADLKALRERVGLSQQNLADMLRVNVRSVKRWEHETYPWEAPEEAWEILERAKAVQDEAVRAALDIVDEQREDLGKENHVTITYFRDQAMYDRFGREDGPFGQVNANSRAVATALEARGCEVVFRYPEGSAEPDEG